MGAKRTVIPPRVEEAAGYPRLWYCACKGFSLGCKQVVYFLRNLLTIAGANRGKVALRGINLSTACEQPD